MWDAKVAGSPQIGWSSYPTSHSQVSSSSNNSASGSSTKYAAAADPVSASQRSLTFQSLVTPLTPVIETSSNNQTTCSSGSWSRHFTTSSRFIAFLQGTLSL